MPKPRVAKIPKAIAALQRKVGEKLLTDKQLTTLGNRGEYVGVGNNPTPIKPSNPALVKLGSMLDFMKKGIYSREVFQSEVQRAGLQPQLQRIRGIGDTLFNNRGGGEVYSGTMQQSAQMKGSPRNLPPSPSSTQVLGEAGFTTDSFAVNQPSRTGQPPQYALTRDLQINMGLAKGQGFAGDSNVSSGLSRPPGLDSATKAMGYKLQTPQQTGLPWNVAADPKTGEMLTLKGKPLPPLVGPSFPTHQHTPTPTLASVPASSSSSSLPVQKPTVNGQKPIFRQGFEVSTGTTANPGTTSFFKRTPEPTQGMNPVQRLKFAGGRLVGDVAADATRGIVWRYNHPLAIAGRAFESLERLSGSKPAAAIASFVGLQTIGQTSGTYDLTNPGQAFRPRGFAAAYPVDEADKTKFAPGPWGYAKELIGSYALGRRGGLLPFEQFTKERPDVKQEDWERYNKYLKGGGVKPMPDGTYDVGGFGVLKFNKAGINGPEARLAGFSVTPTGAVAGVAAATVTAAALNPKIRAGLVSKLPSPVAKGLRGTVGVVGKGLGVVGAGYDFYQRLQKGESASQASLGTAIGIEGGFKGGLLGAKLAPNNPIAKAAGLVIGGGLGAIGAGSAFDAITNIGKDARIAEAARREVAIQKGGIGGFVASVAKFTSDPVGYVKEGLQGGKGTIANKVTGDAAMSTATDQLSKATANYKLTRQPDGSIKSEPRDSTTKAERQSNANAASPTTNNQMSESTSTVSTVQPYASEFDPKIRTAQLQYGARGTAQDRSAAKDKQTRAQIARDRAFANPKATADDKQRAENALLQAKDDNAAAQGGQGDRNLESEERRTTQTNRTKIATTELTGQYNVKVAQTKGHYDNQGKVITGEYNLKNTGLKGQYTLKNTELLNEGKARVAGIGYMGKVDSATINADGKVRTAGVTGGYKVAQEGVKQSGAANVAVIKAGATLGAAGLAAGAKVDSAKIALQGTAYKADATVKVASIKSSSVTDAAQAKAESEGSKAAASFAANLNKSTANSMATEDKARIARYRSLGIY